MEPQIPNNIMYALNKLNKAGYPSYVVGGCVRDSLLKIAPHDFDITTKAKPEEIKEVFKDNKIINPGGEKHGTVSLYYNKEIIEITTFRLDSEYDDHRHPNNVIFTDDLRQDLERRDFTINAMAYSIDDKLYDYFGGKKDLNNKIIRAVGDPYKRFKEDALRILRALRFSSTLGFKIENETKEAMVALKDTLNMISKERIREELNKMIVGPGFKANALDKDLRQILGVIIPELEPTFDFDQKNKYHPNDLYTHTINVVGSAKNDYIIKIAALLHDLGKVTCKQVEFKDGKEIYHFIGHPDESANIAEIILKRLKYSNEEIQNIVFLVRYHDYILSDKIKNTKRLLAKIPQKNVDYLFDALLNLKEADRDDHTLLTPQIDYDTIRHNFIQIKESNACFTLKSLEVNGHDLISLGFEGKQIGIILNDILTLVINEKIENNKDDIISYIKNNY